MNIASILPDSRYLHHMLDSWILEHGNGELLELMVGHANRFRQFHKATWDELAGQYLNFSRRYQNDFKHFQKTGMYPKQTASAISRLEYDSMLLLSPILSRHRYQLMDQIWRLDLGGQRCLFVGAGPGLEMELVKERFDTLVAYDMEPSSFCQHCHPETLIPKEFFGQEGNFDGVFAVELLEHLSEPYKLLDVLIKVANPGAPIVFSTVSNCPQFDHMYNFKPEEMKNYLFSKHLPIKIHQKINHHHKMLKADTWYDFFVV